MRLHAAATAITAEHDGVVPDSIDELLRLAGHRRVHRACGGRLRLRCSVRRSSTPMCGGCWPGWCAASTNPARPATAADRAELALLLPTEPARAARFSAAVMELGALVCTARNPSCDGCPLADRCRWRLAGAVPGQARRAVQAWHGTDRQVRGRILAVLRESSTPVPDIAFAHTDVEPAQLAACLVSLLARRPGGSRRPRAHRPARLNWPRLRTARHPAYRCADQLAWPGQVSPSCTQRANQHDHHGTPEPRRNLLQPQTNTAPARLPRGKRAGAVTINYRIRLPHRRRWPARLGRPPEPETGASRRGR